MRFNICDHGAVPDARTLNTHAIQQAVDAAFAAGGGTVVVPSGVFVTGSFRLASHVYLELEPGAVLRGSDRLEDWRLDGRTVGLILTVGASHTGIRGRGRIEGNGEAFMDRRGHESCPSLDRRFTRQGDAYLSKPEHWVDGPVRPAERPGQLICFLRCDHVEVRDVHICKPPHWTMQFGDCDFVHVTGLHIDNDMSIPNNDGMHFTRCRRVRVSDCDITSGDDCIAISGFRRHPGPGQDLGDPGERITEDVVVTNCILASWSAGVRIGAGEDAIRRVCLSNLVMRKVNRGIVIWQRDGNTIEQVRIDNVVMRTHLLAGLWWGKAEPLAISSVRRRADGPDGCIRNIAASHFTIEAEGGIMIYSQKPGQISDIQLRDFRLHLKNTPNHLTHGGNFDLRPVGNQSELAIFQHDILPIYARQVDQLRLSDIHVTADPALPDFVSSRIVQD